MLQLLAAFTLAAAPAIQAAPAASPDPGAQAVQEEQAALVALVKTFESAASYTLTYKSTGSGKSGGNAAKEPKEGKERKPDAKPDADGEGEDRDAWTVQYQRDHPLHFTKGHADFYRRGHRFVALGKDDEWTTIELPPSSDGAAGRTEKPRGLARFATEIERIPLPHECFSALDGKLAAVKRAEVDGKSDFVATLTPAAVREWMAGNKVGKPGGKAPPPEQKPPESGAPAPAAPSWSGTLHVVATASGIERFEVDLKSITAAGERTVRREFCVSSLGTTEVKVPEPAAKLLDRDD